MWRRRRAMDGLDDDIRDHLEREVAEQVGRGMSPAEAHRRALIAFGNVALAKEDTRAVWVRVWLDDLVRDVRYALRTLARNPVFAAAVVITLGLGIGGTTAIFSVVDALFVRAPDGVSDPESLRRLFVRRDAGAMSSPDGSGGIWSDAQTVRDGSRAFVGVAAYQAPELIDLGRGETAARLRASVVSGEFFGVLGIRPAFGRLFLAEEDGVPGAYPVAVISHTAWQARFGGAADVVGSTLLINGRPLQVVGVTQRGFHGIETEGVDLWLPAAIAPYVGLEREDSWRSSLTLSGATRHVVRLRSVHEGERAAAEASRALARSAMTERILDPTPEVILRPIVLASLSGSSWVVDLSLWLLIAAVLVLVISTANVANLLLARGVTRRREFAMRLSLGAGGLRIARQQLTESIALALLGAAAGFVVAYCGVALLRQFPLPPGAGRIDARLLGFSLALSLLTAMAFSLFPAWRAIQVDPVRVLKGWHAGCTGAQSHPPDSGRAPGLTLIRTTGWRRTLRAIARAGLGHPRWCRPRSSAHRRSQPTSGRRTSVVALLRRVLPACVIAPVERIRRRERGDRVLSAVRGLGLVSELAGTRPRRVLGRHHLRVSARSFETAGTRLLRGRTIVSADQPGTEPVAVVNEAMALLLAKDGNPVGQCVDIRTPGLSRVPCLHIVGVANRSGIPILTRNPSPRSSAPRLKCRKAFRPPFTPAARPNHRRGGRAKLRRCTPLFRAYAPDLPYVSVFQLTEHLRNSAHFSSARRSSRSSPCSRFCWRPLVSMRCWDISSLNGRGEVGVRRALGAPGVVVIRLVVAKASFRSAWDWQLVSEPHSGYAHCGLVLYGVVPSGSVRLDDRGVLPHRRRCGRHCSAGVARPSDDPMVALRQD